jgi:Tudor domain
VKKRVESTDFIEKWMELKVGEEHPVIVSSFGSCSSFFIQIMDDSDGWEDMMQMLNDLERHEPLKTTLVGTFCIVEFNNELLRAKIIRSSETSVMCFCLDSAELVYFHNEHIRAFEIPPKILNFMPFQAINCRLTGIKAPLDFAWTGYIYKKVVNRMCQQHVRVVRKIEKNLEMIPWGLQNVNSYEVVLFENGSGDGETVGDVLVKHQLADYDL